MNAQYVHQRPEWPRFRWDQPALAAPLAEVRHRQGRLLGRMEGLGCRLQREAGLRTLTLDVLKSSEIHDETLDAEEVRSSLARRLGLDTPDTVAADRGVEAVVEMTLDAIQNFARPLDAERLFGWHAALFHAAYSGTRRIAVGAWRDDANGPTLLVSGAIGNEKVRYEAPAAERLPGEMAAFFAWANSAESHTDAVLRAALAHLWFVTIHPFEDGNGRIARAIADWQLARAEKSPQRFYSMSAQIRAERDDYYALLERTQRGNLDVTPWMAWFLGCLDRALGSAEKTLAAVLHKARFLERVAQTSINARQRAVLNRLLDGFEGKLTTTKWARFTDCSHDTALRDIRALIESGILRQDPRGGRSTSYSLRD